MKKKANTGNRKSPERRLRADARDIACGKALAEAVISQACRDYAKELRSLRKWCGSYPSESNLIMIRDSEREVQSLWSFFGSAWFDLADLDGDYLEVMIREEIA